MFYRTFRDPDIKADKDIDLLKQGCQLRHVGIDKDIKGINESISSIQRSFTLLQENDLKHIEMRMNDMEKGMVEIKTMLNERLPKKNV
jgi:phage-related minor tail protein